MKHTILMADVIDSGLKDQALLIHDFKSIVTRANEVFRKKILSPLTITLGDEFQGVPKSTGTALDILLYLEEELIHEKLNFKLRYVLVEGEIDTMINNSRAFEMLGPGLTDARLQLTNLKKSNHRFYIKIENKLLSETLNNNFFVLQSLIDSWNIEKDYTIVSNLIKYEDYKKVAEIINKNRSQVWKKEINLNFKSYQAIKNNIRITKSLLQS